MARTTQEWKEIIGNEYMSLSAVQIIYSLTADEISAGFSATFSIVSIENLLFYAFGYACFLIQSIVESAQESIQAIVDKNYICNDAYWHDALLGFQSGDDLTLNAITKRYEYAVIDSSKQIIKRVAVREKYDADDSNKYKVFIYVAGESNGEIIPLTNAQKSELEPYIFKKKPSGVLTKLISGDGDTLDIALTVNYNPLLLNSDGELINDSSKPVDLAAENYIKVLNTDYFKGNLNVTRFVDSIQGATGVVDVKITGLSINSVAKTELWGTYESTNGWFKIGTLTVTYQPQTSI